MIIKGHGWKKLGLKGIMNFGRKQKYSLNILDRKTFEKQILPMEKYIWEENSDPDLDEIDIEGVKSLVIESNSYIAGYILLDIEYVDDMTLLDISDLVIVEPRIVIPFKNQILEQIISTIENEELDGVIVNPNNLSRPLVKRLERENIYVKYRVGYPSYTPTGYLKNKKKRGN